MHARKSIAKLAQEACRTSFTVSRSLVTIPTRGASIPASSCATRPAVNMNRPLSASRRFASTGSSDSPTPTQMPHVNATPPTCSTCPNIPGEPNVYSFFDNDTSTWQYIVTDPVTKKAAIVDPVLDYSPASGVVSTKTADGLLAYVTENQLDVVYLLETHAHADHLTAAQYLKQRLGGSVPVAIGKRIKSVQERFGTVYGVPKEWMENAFDKYWEDDERFKIGDLEFQVFHLPGHTPDHVGYSCGHGLFVGDTLFYPDVGSARADFPGGSPVDLYKSIERVLSLSPDTRIYSGHDYPPHGEEEGKRCWSLVSEQRERNVHLKNRLKEIAPTTDKAEGSNLAEKLMNSFIEWRAKRDSSLGAPRLLHPSLQVNICAGRLPLPDDSGRRVFKIPLKVPEGL